MLRSNRLIDLTGLTEDNVSLVFYTVGCWNNPDTVQIKKAVDGLDRLVSEDWDKSGLIYTSVYRRLSTLSSENRIF